MACSNVPIAAADIHVEGVQGTRMEAYPDGLDLMQDVPGEAMNQVYVRWEHVPRLLRALEEMMAAHRAYEASQGGHDE